MRRAIHPAIAPKSEWLSSILTLRPCQGGNTVSLLASWFCLWRSRQRHMTITCRSYAAKHGLYQPILSGLETHPQGRVRRC